MILTRRLLHHVPISPHHDSMFHIVLSTIRKEFERGACAQGRHDRGRFLNAGEFILGCGGGRGVSVAEVLACFGSELGEELVGEEVGEEGFDDDEAGADDGRVGFDDGPDDGCVDGPFWEDVSLVLLRWVGWI